LGRDLCYWDRGLFWLGGSSYNRWRFHRLGLNRLGWLLLWQGDTHGLSITQVNRLLLFDRRNRLRRRFDRNLYDRFCCYCGRCFGRWLGFSAGGFLDNPLWGLLQALFRFR
jgi:hypothetical protein